MHTGVSPEESLVHCPSQTGVGDKYVRPQRFIASRLLQAPEEFAHMDTQILRVRLQTWQIITLGSQVQ